MLHVALVGAGGMARNYRKIYTLLPDVEWTAAIDLNPEQLEKCRAEGAKRTSEDFAEALEMDIDLVDISTPNHLHEQQAVAALVAGKHVLLQKPIANTMEAAGRILKAAAGSKGVLGMYMSSYANPMVWEIKQMMEEGHLGKIQSVRARDSHRGGLRHPPEATWRSSRDQTGGGSFIQLSIHAVNLMQWWLSSPIVEVSAFSQNQYSPNIGGDDLTVCIAKFAGGAFGVFDSGYASEGVIREIYGTAGWVRMFERENQLEMNLDRPYTSGWLNYDTPGIRKTFSMPPRVLDDASSPINPHRMFIEAIRTGKKPMMDGETGRRDLAVVIAAYESAAQNKSVAVCNSKTA
ncbi:MAG: Gfo/Idh/MocA family oxidoreductase [Tepidisphaeraceae bacterium]|jgi:predicted dehydrogenase